MANSLHCYIFSQLLRLLRIFGILSFSLVIVREAVAIGQVYGRASDTRAAPNEPGVMIRSRGGRGWESHSSTRPMWQAYGSYMWLPHRSSSRCKQHVPTNLK